MAREPGKLTALAVARAKRRGLYSDGGGLYLQVASSGARSWIFRYQTAGRRHYMGLGGAAAVSLADARQKAGEARRVLVAGNDPINATRTRVAASAAKAANA
ncbi:MAG: Arm DNA-binding domain-containing protein, partial [Proteobacteria bacterium]|nr:Arm DNA-binding domain-containing protein [Pseudomonadota bacterium]